MARRNGLETERKRAFQGLCMAFSDQLVPGRTALLLRAFRGQQMAETRRTANELTSGGELEALSHGLFGLLHGEKRRKQISCLRV